jgi:hypothetical protein
MHHRACHDNGLRCVPLPLQLAHRALVLACKAVAQDQQRLETKMHTGSGAVLLAGSAAAEQQQWQQRQQLAPVAVTAAAALMHCLVLGAHLLQASALLSDLIQQPQEQLGVHNQPAAALSGLLLGENAACIQA